MVRLKRSVYPLDWGCIGVILLCSMPFHSRNSLNFWLVKYAALSVFKISGIPTRLKMWRNFLIIASLVEVFMMQTKGYREYSSVMTSAYSWEGKGPSISAATSVQQAFGRGLMDTGWVDYFSGVVAWQSRQVFTVYSTSLSILGKYTLLLSNYFVFVDP